MATNLTWCPTVAWRFTAASPGTLDIDVNVIAPVQFQIDGVDGAQLLTLLCPDSTSRPIQSTRDVTPSVQARHRWLLPDRLGAAPSVDDWVETIRQARRNAAIPYFTYHALATDGVTQLGPNWRVLFLLSQPLVVAYEGGHRYVDVSLFEAVAP